MSKHQATIHLIAIFTTIFNNHDWKQYINWNNNVFDWNKLNISTDLSIQQRNKKDCGIYVVTGSESKCIGIPIGLENDTVVAFFRLRMMLKLLTFKSPSHLE